MLTVTDSAARRLNQMLSDAPEGTAIRFVPQGDGLIPQIHNPQSDDETFEHEGKTVLALDQQVASALDDKTLDVDITQQGSQLVLVDTPR